MELFATLKKVREFERQQLPFLRSLLDFDIIVEIGFAQEQKKPLTPKPLFLLALGSVSTVRRRLASLIDQGIVKRQKDAGDGRSHVLTLSAASLRLLGRYGAMLTSTSSS